MCMCECGSSHLNNATNVEYSIVYIYIYIIQKHLSEQLGMPHYSLSVNVQNFRKMQHNRREKNMTKFR